MSRPTDWSPVGLSCDPIPGDPLALGAAAARYHDTAHAIETAAGNLRRLDGTTLVSKAFAVTFERIQEVAGKLDSAQSRVEGAGKVLDLYRPVLERTQAESERALHDADACRNEQRRHAAQADQLKARYYVTNDPNQLQDIADQYTDAARRAIAAQHGVNNAKARIKAAIAERDSAAQAAMHDLDDLDASSPVKDSTWDKVVDWFEDNVLPVIKAVVKAVADFAEKYGWIVDLVGTILTIATAFIPVIGPLVSLCVGLAFTQLSIFMNACKWMNAGFRLRDGEITVEEYKATQTQAMIGIGVGVVTIGMAALGGVGKAVGNVATLSKTAASLGLKQAAKDTAKLAAVKGAKTVATKGVAAAKEAAQREVSGDPVENARRAGEERLHQERLQQEQRMRDASEAYRNGTATDYYRREYAPCAA